MYKFKNVILNIYLNNVGYSIITGEINFIHLLLYINTPTSVLFFDALVYLNGRYLSLVIQISRSRIRNHFGCVSRGAWRDVVRDNVGRTILQLALGYSAL